MSYPLEPIHIDGLPPVKSHEDDAAYDLRSQMDYTVQPGDTKLIDCGFAIAIPNGCVGLVCSRSGLALSQGVFVLNAPGVIDPSYRGEVRVILHNLGHQPFCIRPGDRIAQLLIVPTRSFRLVQTKLNETLRGDGGFGSTGVS
jgi:dUTP pyrophosphatase